MEKFRYAKPDIEGLKKEYTLIDMHIHTSISDGKASPQDVIQRAKNLGIGISITDHDSIEGSLMAGRHTDILSIPGIEFSAKKDTHVLVYFYKTEDLKDFYERYAEGKAFKLGVFEISEFAAKYNCLFGIAHPTGYAPGGFGTSKIKMEGYSKLKKLDFIEIINGHQFGYYAKGSYKIASQLDKGFTGGSDAHHINCVGSVVTGSKKKTLKEFLDSIKRKETFVHGRPRDLARRYMKTPLYFLRAYNRRF
ncbi:MAG: PHP domain-containing protein [bacterium]|nr:PHP domain-containing protein [bacterium]